MSGSDLNLQVDKDQMEAYLSLIAEDGLLYTPANTPGRRRPSRPLIYSTTDEDYTSVMTNSRMMLALMYHYQRDRNSEYLGAIRNMVRGLVKIAIHKDDYAYYPDHRVIVDFSYLKKSGYKSTDEPRGEFEGPEGSVLDSVGRIIRPLSQWYAMSGDDKALELAREVTNFILKPKFWAAGEMPDVVGHEQGRWLGHAHARLATLRGLLWYANVVNDRKLKELVRSAYEYSRSFGIPRIGWFPSWVGPHTFGRMREGHCEGCQLTDIVGLAIMLSDAGMGEYWDDVDAYVRNQFVEQQFVDRDLLEAAKSEWLGGFCGGGHITDLNNCHPARCCTGNGPQGLYYAWESILRHRDGVVQVNLLLNRVSPWLDLNSYLPYEGKVVMLNKRARRLSVRIPGWVDRKAVETRVNHRRVESFWVGNYVVIDQLKEMDTVTIRFPMVEETVTYTVPDGVYNPPLPEGAHFIADPGPYELPRTRYTCHFKGNTLVDISPRDTTRWLREGRLPYPIYQRDHFKANKAPLRKVHRYIAAETIPW
jgi:hypothetical protein